MQYDVILSGGIAKVKNYKVRFAIAQVQSRVKWPGASVWNPATLPQDRDYRWLMRKCMMAILDQTGPQTVCVRLKGWRMSMGAFAEWALCRCLGIKIVDQWW